MKLIIEYSDGSKIEIEDVAKLAVCTSMGRPICAAMEYQKKLYAFSSVNDRDFDEFLQKLELQIE